jgi:hypothetical protein
MLVRWNGTIAPFRMSENATAFAANAAVIDLHAFILVYSIHASRQLFPGFGTHALNVLGEDGLKIELEQSECTMCDPSGAAAAHRIVPVD